VSWATLDAVRRSVAVLTARRRPLALPSPLLRSEAGDTEGEGEDLSAAAAYGSEFARMMTSGTNPYVTLCHDMVTQMLAATRSAAGGVGDSGSAGVDASSCATAGALATPQQDRGVP
jgi:hypothetical protein